MVSDTVHRFEYPPALMFLNGALSPLRKFPSVAGLRPIDIARSACAAEGIVAPETEQDLERLLGDDFITAVELCTRWRTSHMGTLQWRAVLVSCVRVRLQLESYLSSGGERGSLERPLFVVGLPRSGTTFLQYLLASPVQNRGLSFWELMRPVPRPARALDELKRRVHGSVAASVFRIVAPEYKKLHLTTANTLEECWYLMMPSYRVFNADFPMPESSYGDWMLKSDMGPAYERYRTLLEVLQAQVGKKRLVLKCPDHLWFLEDLLRTFPEGRVLWIHRDPAKTVPSYAAQMALPARQYMGRVDPHRLGERLVSRFEQGVARAEQARTFLGDGRVADICYTDLVRDPLGTIEAALRTLGEELSSDARASMQGVLSMRRSDHKGQHIYRAETYGLSKERLHETFGDYMERYGIERE